MPYSNKLTEFNLPKGFTIGNRFVVESMLGSGWESEVYLIHEKATGIERTAKLFFPHRNINNNNAKRLAAKLHKIRNSQICIQYYSQELIYFRGHRITCFISEYIEGEILGEYIERQKGKRLHYFQALHLLHSICKGLEVVHKHNEYHGDIHEDNIFIKPYGLEFQVKLIDPFDWRDSKRLNIRKDIYDLIRVFYNIIGGQKHYSKQPQAVKDICCGLKHSLIDKKFKNAGMLRLFLEGLNWES